MKDGGPAFPHIERPVGWGENGETVIVERWTSGGMSLRDYFMAHAPAQEIEKMMPTTVGDLAAFIGLSQPSAYSGRGHRAQALAKCRAIWADAILAERERR